MPKVNASPAPTPAAASTPAPIPTGKIAKLVELLRRPEGAALADLQAATGWQAHSVRGAISGAIKKGFGLQVVSEKADGVRRYRIAS